MKKWIFLVILVFLISAGIFRWKNSAPKPEAPSNVLSQADTIPSTPSVWPQSTVIEFDGTPIRISWAVVNPKDVELYSNLKEQKLSEEIKANKSCKVLVNGGFYSQERAHLGLFIADFKTVSDSMQSTLFNGFIWIDIDNRVFINASKPNSPRLALQSGPILMLNSEPLPLTINNDEPNRRIAAGITNDDQLIFLVFYKESAEYEGPMLGKLPEIIDLFERQTGIDVVDAINLDGGIHSIFASGYDRLVELEHVGSYFCAK